MYCSNVHTITPYDLPTSLDELPTHKNVLMYSSIQSFVGGRKWNDKFFFFFLFYFIVHFFFNYLKYDSRSFLNNLYNYS